MGWKERLKQLYWKIDPTEVEIVHQRNHKPFKDDFPAFDDIRVNKAFRHDNITWEHQEFIVKTKAVLIEPDLGYAIRGLRTIVSASRKNGKFGLPSPQRTLKARFLGGHQHMSIAIMFDGSLGNNYFYFFAAVLHKIYLLEKHLELDGIPILVGRNIYEKKYFKEITEIEPFANLNWIKLTRHIKVDQLIISSPLYYDSSYWKRTKALFSSAAQEPNTRQRIFVSRTNRRISNFHEILPLLENTNFEVIDTGACSVAQQIELFGNASHIIGIHGAGLANIGFAKPGVKIMDIAPSTLLHSHYYWLSKVCGGHYDILVGEGNPDVYGDFYVDPELFSKKLQKLLS